MGAEWESAGLAVAFSLDRVPTGEFEIIVIPDVGDELRYKVSADTRKKVR